MPTKLPTPKAKLPDTPEATKLLSALAFGEATKKDMKSFKEDVLGVVSAVYNRFQRPERFGGTVEDIVFSPSQFSSVGSKEWNKFVSKKYNEGEGVYAKAAVQAVSNFLRDQKPVHDGDHFYSVPVMKQMVAKRKALPKFTKVYPKVYETQGHAFYKEV